MSAEENKAVIRRMIEEVYNQNDLEVLDELVAQHPGDHRLAFGGHLDGPNDLRGPHPGVDEAAGPRPQGPLGEPTVNARAEDQDRGVLGQDPQTPNLGGQISFPVRAEDEGQADQRSRDEAAYPEGSPGATTT